MAHHTFTVLRKEVFGIFDNAPQRADEQESLGNRRASSSDLPRAACCLADRWTRCPSPLSYKSLIIKRIFISCGQSETVFGRRIDFRKLANHRRNCKLLTSCLARRSWMGSLPPLPRPSSAQTGSALLRSHPQSVPASVLRSVGCCAFRIHRHSCEGSCNRC